LGKTNIGMVGVAWIARRQCEGIKASKYASVIAITDIDKSRLTKASTEWGVKGYSKVEELLENPKVEAVSICTPHSVHEQQVMKAL